MGALRKIARQVEDNNMDGEQVKNIFFDKLESGELKQADADEFHRCTGLSCGAGEVCVHAGKHTIVVSKVFPVLDWIKDTVGETFQPGDIVRLKSGGPLMVIGERVTNALVLCSWCDEGEDMNKWGQLHSETLATATLVKAETTEIVTDVRIFGNSITMQKQRAYITPAGESEWKTIHVGSPCEDD